MGYFAFERTFAAQILYTVLHVNKRMNSEKSGKRALLASIFTLLPFEPLKKIIYAYDMMILLVATKGDLIY